MIPDDVDDLIDGLPLHMRNKVLAAFDEEEEDEGHVLTHRQKVAWWWAFFPCLALAMSGAAYGILQGATLIRIPEAVIVITLTNIPFGVLILLRVGVGKVNKERDPEEGTEDE